MPITEDIFQAFLKCGTKSYLKFSGTVGFQREFSDWERNLAENYKQKCCVQLRSDFPEEERLVGASLSQDFEKNKCRLVIDCLVQAQEFQSHIHALERITSPGRTKH